MKLAQIDWLLGNETALRDYVQQDGWWARLESVYAETDRQRLRGNTSIIPKHIAICELMERAYAVSEQIKEEKKTAVS